MTKWLITFAGRASTKWKLVEFGGSAGAESRGIVDILAIRKDHTRDHDGLKRGDLFEIVLIQTKGGNAPRPTADDVSRLNMLAGLYHAKAVVLAEWKRGSTLQLYRLEGYRWMQSKPESIFGRLAFPSQQQTELRTPNPRGRRSRESDTAATATGRGLKGVQGNLESTQPE
jgi:hypothetical protein